MAYQKVDVKEIPVNPFREIGEHWVLISAKKDGKVNTMTASWGAMGVIWGKNAVTVYIRPQRYTKQFVDGSEYFTVTLFNGYRQELGVLGTKSGRDGDKIGEVGFQIEEVEGQPTFRQGTYVLVCRKMYSDLIKEDRFYDGRIAESVYPGKDFHEMYIGEIVGAYRNV